MQIIIKVLFGITISNSRLAQHVKRIGITLVAIDFAVFISVFNGLTQYKLMPHNTHGFLHCRSNHRFAHLLSHPIQEPSSGSTRINTNHLACHHKTPSRGIDHHSVIVFEMFFPIGDAHFVANKGISGIVIWHPNQGFSQAHQQDTLLRI